MTTAKVESKCILMTLPDEAGEPGPTALIFELTIDCPLCGQHTVRFAGHHLRTINRAVAEAVEQFPEYCGKDGGQRVSDRLQFGGRGPTDPSMN